MSIQILTSWTLTLCFLLLSPKVSKVLATHLTWSSFMLSRLAGQNTLTPLSQITPVANLILNSSNTLNILGLYLWLFSTVLPKIKKICRLSAFVCFDFSGWARVFVLILQVEHVFASYPSDNYPSWWVVFSPLFVSDALNAYFCVIVFIRMYIDVSTVKNWTDLSGIPMVETYTNRVW